MTDVDEDALWASVTVHMNRVRDLRRKMYKYFEEHPAAGKKEIEEKFLPEINEALVELDNVTAIWLDHIRHL